MQLLPELPLFSQHRLQPLWFLTYAKRVCRLPRLDWAVPHWPFFSVVTKKQLDSKLFLVHNAGGKKIRDMFYRTGCTVSTSVSEAFLKMN